MTREELQIKRKEIEKVIDDLYKEVHPNRRIRLHSSKVSNITAKDIALIANIEKVLGDTDGDMPLKKPVVYPYLAQDRMFIVKKLCEEWGDQIGKQANLATKMLNIRPSVKEFESWTPAQLRKATSRKLTLSDLRIMYMNEPIDGISEHEELILRGVFGLHEKEWRAQREFFEFVCRPRYDVERSALVSAAHAVVEAMRLAGENEETVRRYRRNFIAPVLRKHY